MPFFSARPTAIFNLRSRRKLPFLLRQIITTGYVAAGYQNSSPWRNVNSLNQSNDTCTNHGDLLQSASAYAGGMHNKNNAFILGADGMSDGTTVASFSMRTNSTYTKPPSLNLTYSTGSSGTLIAQDDDGNYTYAWNWTSAATGNTTKFNLVTEATMSNPAVSTSISGTSSQILDETKGLIWGDGNNANLKLVYATETFSNTGFASGFHGQQKGLSAKTGFGYGGNEGSYNGGNNFRKTNFATESIQSTMSKPITNSGEENFVTGQDRGYMLGMYDGAQNNRAYRFNYATDTGFEGGSSMQPSGGVGGGRSSGYGYWRD